MLCFDGKLEEYIELFSLFAVVGLGCQALSNSQHITTPSPPFEDNDIHIIFHTKRKSFQHAPTGAAAVQTCWLSVANPSYHLI